MSVKYDIVFQNNRRIPLQGPCFGAMAAGEWFGSSTRREDMTRLKTNNTLCKELFDNHIEMASFIQFYGEPSRSIWRNPSDSGNEYVQRYYQHMRELIQDIPWLKASVHPLVGVIRVPIKDAPSDKAMMTLFLVRNLATNENYSSYRDFLAKGYKPLAAAILSSHWCIGRGNTMNPQANWYYTSVGEYNWLSPYTFGKESLQRLVQAGKDFNPWYLGTWASLKGYRRDSWFRQNNYTFNRTLPRHDSYDNINHHRKLIDCLSIKNDTPIYEGVVGPSGPDRYQWEILIGNMVQDSAFSLVLENFNELCLSYGYNPLR